MDTSPSVVSGALLAGKYRVDRLLGEGGMGVVLAATNEALRQRVAIKLLRTGAHANAEALGRFEREARAAASLRSEHVARVLDVGKLEDGRPYMVMEYLEGRDLGDVIDQSPPLPVGAVIDFVLQACEAIAEAHAAGIIHRDLKPTNLFLAATVDGRPLVKVLDFGISKMDDAAEDMSLTRTTEIIGSPSYMSPEQLRSSKDVDVRTDIWALGVILYELLTKCLPFQASTVTELVAVVLTDPVPDVRVLRPDVPDALADAITRGCLSRKRDERFATVAELVRAIAPFGGDDEVVTMVDRVARVAAGSARSLPPITGSGLYSAVPPDAASASAPGASHTDTVAASGPPTNSSGVALATPSDLPVANADSPPRPVRLAIHGGTSVAWGETQVDVQQPAARRRSRWPLIGAAAGLVVVLAGAGTGVLVYMKRASTRPTSGASATPPQATMPLPDARKDLPPLAAAAPEASAAAPVAVAPVAPPDAPSALPPARVPTATKKAPAGPSPATGKPPPPAGPKHDDLSDIGRR